jgi:hypothetical protein
MEIVSRISEAEVVAEFLKAEFYHCEYDSDRQRFDSIVHNPDLTDAGENAIRLALLFRRRGAMWRELPEDTQWCEIELEPEEIERVNVFPRARWRRISGGNFQAVNVAERIRRQMQRGKSSEWLAKISVMKMLLQSNVLKGTAVLIGVDGNHPVTLLDGNHRLVASLLLPREIMLPRLRMVCGFSPKMETCCWYKTNWTNVLHYTRNRIRHFRSRDVDYSQLALQMLPKSAPGSLRKPKAASEVEAVAPTATSHGSAEVEVPPRD